MDETHALQRLREVIRHQHKALSTESTYSCWLRRYIAALRRMPDGLAIAVLLISFTPSILGIVPGGAKAVHLVGLLVGMVGGVVTARIAVPNQGGVQSP